MTSFVVKHRATTKWKEDTVDADTRELAIQKVLDAAPEDTEVEVSSVSEEIAETAPKAAAKKEEPHKKEESHGKK
jgi:hypothetical protein